MYTIVMFSLCNPFFKNDFGGKCLTYEKTHVSFLGIIIRVFRSSGRFFFSFLFVDIFSYCQCRTKKKIPQTLGKRVVSSQNSSNIVSTCARIQSPFVFFNSERKDLRHSVLLLMCLQRKKKARVVLQKPELILVALIRHTHTTTKHSSRFFLYLIPLGKVSRITKL